MSRPGGAAESEQLSPACIALTFTPAWATFAVPVNEWLTNWLILQTAIAVYLVTKLAAEV